MAKNTIVALSLINSADLIAKDDALERLQAGAVMQYQRLRSIRNEETLRGLMLGLMLHRIKHSLPYGDFGKWTATNMPRFGTRWVNYLMRLSLVFVEECKVTKPHLLAVPGDQTELQLDGLQGMQRTFMVKALKFVGDHSLSELLDKHGIKETAKVGGARASGKPKPVTLDAEQLYLQARDEIGLTLNQAETLLLKENRLQHLAGHPDEIAGVVAALAELHAKVSKAAKPLMKPSGKR